MKKIILISALVLLPLVSFAAIDIQKTNNAVTLTTTKNTYIAGNIINVFQEKTGDVYLAGNLLSITGKIDQDLVAVGGNMSIVSEIGGDLRAAAANLNINAPIGGDLVAAGGNVEIAPRSVVQGDLIMASGRIYIDGTINGNAKIVAGQVDISGVLNKGADIRANKLTIEKTAVINGNINYHGNEPAVVNEGARINGEISFTKTQPASAKTSLTGFLTLIGFLKFLMLLTASLILFLLFRRNAPKLTNEAVGDFWKRAIRGLIILVVVPVVIILLFITLVGSIIGIFGIALYFFFLMLAAALMGLIAAELLNRLVFRGTKARALNWWMVVLGVIAIQIVNFIPFVGWIANLLVFLAALGTIAKLFYRQTKTLAE